MRLGHAPLRPFPSALEPTPPQGHLPRPLSYAIADQLNAGLLPPGHIAEGVVTLGHIAVEMATRDVKVLVYNDATRSLVGAIELVCPNHKARPSSPRAFAIKCLSYLQSRIGLIVVDIVTEGSVNLPDVIGGLVGIGLSFPNSHPTYAAAYQPFRRETGNGVAVWTNELAVGEPLPVLPLWLRDHDTPIRIDLESTYAEAGDRCRIPGDSGGQVSL